MSRNTCFVFLLLLCSITSGPFVSSAVEYQWTGSANDGNRWETGGNWSGNATPNKSNNYRINKGGTKVVVNDSVTANGYAVYVDGTAKLQIGSGATMTLDRLLSVGSKGTPEAILETGGTLTTPFLHIGTVTNSNSSGLLSMTGGNLNVTIGSSDNRPFVLGYDNNTVGTANISGGTVNISNGGSVYLGGYNSITAVSTTRGDLNLSGGAQMNVGGTIYAGHNGTGSLTVSQTPETSPTVLKAAGLTIGNAANSVGTAAFSGGETTISGNFTVGANGTGSLTVSQTPETSPTVLKAAGLTIGNAANSVGTAAFSGGETTISGNLTVGASGVGKFYLSDSGSVRLASVSESKTTYYNFSVGTGDSGKLDTHTIDISGGTLTARIVDLSTAANNQVSMSITGGTVNVISNDTNLSEFLVGRAAGANVNMTGGTINAGRLLIGSNGGTGTMTVSGGTLNFKTASGGGDMIIGNNSAGSLTLKGSAVVNTDTLKMRFKDVASESRLEIEGGGVTFNAKAITTTKSTKTAPAKISFVPGVDGLSTLAVSGNVTGADLKVSVMDELNGVALLNNSYELITCGGTFSMGGVELTDSNLFDLVLDETNKKLIANYQTPGGKLGTNKGSIAASEIAAAGDLSDLRLTFDSSSKSLTDIAQFLTAETGLDSLVANDSVYLWGDALEGADNFYWDFSALSADTLLLSGAANRMSADIPEPSSWLLLALGVLFVRTLAVKRNKKQ